MDARQASKLSDCAGGWACAMSGGKTEHSRPVKTMLPGTLMHPRAALEDFMGWRLTQDLRFGFLEDVIIRPIWRKCLEPCWSAILASNFREPIIRRAACLGSIGLPPRNGGQNCVAADFVALSLSLRDTRARSRPDPPRVILGL
jgi:hypothetical protein